MIHSAQTHFFTFSDHYSHLKLICLAKFLKSEDVRTDVQTSRVKLVITTGRDCESVSVDQKWVIFYQ